MCLRWGFLVSRLTVDSGADFKGCMDASGAETVGYVQVQKFVCMSLNFFKSDVPSF